METLLMIDEVLCVASIFALVFFCAVVPKTAVAKYLYILFGITLIPIGIQFLMEGEPWYICIWVFLFSAVGIIVGIVLIRSSKHMSKEEQEVVDQNFGKMARRSGMRRMHKEIWKNLK